MHAKDYTRSLSENGQCHFSTAQAIAAVGGSPDAVRGQLRRLKRQGLLCEPARGFHVIIPPEYSRLGCLPAEQFIDQLMQTWNIPYYIGLLSAAERYGAAHGRPQVTQVIAPRNRLPLSCGSVRVEFIARGDMASMPKVNFNTPRGTVWYASPEVTALELVGYPGHAGGLGTVATVLAALAERMDPAQLLEAAQRSPVSWSQRLGYLLERDGQDTLAGTLHSLVQEHARSFTPLRRAASVTGCARSSAWKLVINAEAEADE
jgi:predicted transcriptional regulator of viral defense system